MKAECLLENFDRIAESPGSIAHLRYFILDLAVRGKLVEQDLNDESASELIERIQIRAARNSEGDCARNVTRASSRRNYCSSKQALDRANPRTSASAKIV